MVYGGPHPRVRVVEGAVSYQTDDRLLWRREFHAKGASDPVPFRPSRRAQINILWSRLGNSVARDRVLLDHHVAATRPCECPIQVIGQDPRAHTSLHGLRASRSLQSAFSQGLGLSLGAGSPI